MNCREVQEKIVARREGWLPAAEAEALDAHVASCEACRRVWAADEKLAVALGRIHAVPVSVPSWHEVREARLARRPSTLPKWLLAPALGAAAASVALLWLTWQHSPSSTVRSEVAAIELLRDTAPAAHMMMTASDPTSDPNRLVLALSQLEGGQ